MAAERTAALDQAARHAILTERFRTVLHVAEIPAPVMSAAGKAREPAIAGYKLEMADPGQPFQATDVIIDRSLPGHRLIAAYASSDYWLLHYEVGGVAHTFHLAVFSLHDGNARFLYHESLRPTVKGLDQLRNIVRDSKTVEGDETYFY